MKKKKFTEEELNALSLEIENWDPDDVKFLSEEECQITRAMISQTAAHDNLVQAIQDARNAGISWAKVAKLIGVTPQAAHKRYGPLILRCEKAPDFSGAFLF